MLRKNLDTKGMNPLELPLNMDKINTPEIKNLLRGLRAMTKWGLGPSGGGGTVDDWSSGCREAEERMRKEIRRLLKEFNLEDYQK